MVCPFCHRDAPSTPAGFTWWGGFLGAKVLSHVTCTGCRRGYNGKTGRSNTTGIVVYSVVVGALVIALMLLVLRA